MKRIEEVYNILARLQTEKNRGISAGEISEVMAIDRSNISRYLNSLYKDGRVAKKKGRPVLFYIKDLVRDNITTAKPREEAGEEISSLELLGEVINQEFIQLTDEIISLAKKKFGREFEEDTIARLALHLYLLFNKLKNYHGVINPLFEKLYFAYNNEFKFILELSDYIQEKIGLTPSLDVIAYLTMYLAKKEQALVNNSNIVLFMHGDDLASSMAGTVNQLLDTDLILPVDKPLTVPWQQIYGEIKKQISQNENKEGLLITDLGFERELLDKLEEEINKPFKVIGEAGIAKLLEVGLNVLLGLGIEDIYQILHFQGNQVEHVAGSEEKDIIVTSCFTGEGATRRLQNILEDNFTGRSRLEIVNLNLSNRSEILAAVRDLQQKGKVVAIIGTVDLRVDDIPFISAMDVLTGKGIEAIKSLLEGEKISGVIKSSLGRHIRTLPGEELVEDVLQVIKGLETTLDLVLKISTKTNIVIYFSLLLDRLKRGIREKEFPGLKKFRIKYFREMELMRKALRPLEEKYGINIRDNARARLCNMLLKDNTNNRNNIEKTN